MIASTINLKASPKIPSKSERFMMDEVQWSNENYTGATPRISIPFSLRRLLSSYLGPAIRVRRSSDNAEEDIYFNGEDLDEAALLGFVGSSSGFIRTWYDQFGSLNANQTTTSAQPRIVLDGVIDRVNNKPAIFFNGAHFLLSGTAADWKWLQNDSESSGGIFVVSQCGIVDDPNTLYIICGTSATIVSPGGFYLGFEDRISVRENCIANLIGGNTSGTTYSLHRQEANTTLANQQFIAIHTRVNSGTAIERSLMSTNNGLIQKGNTDTGTANASNPRHGLKIGTSESSSGVNSFFMVGYIQELIFIKAHLLGLGFEQGFFYNANQYYKVYQYQNIL